MKRRANEQRAACGDDRGRLVDVHALRVTFGTHLCAAGAIRVDTLLGFDDGSGPFLYAGGDFTTAPIAGGGTIPVNRLAQWNPVLDQWSAVGLSSDPNADPGGGVDGTTAVRVEALAVFDDGTTGPALFVGGSFA
ncbi:MAG: hypothetical protein D6788_05845, partial [Planctomycetota bacterium]